MLRQYLAAGAQGDAAPSCESSTAARHQRRGLGVSTCLDLSTRAATEATLSGGSAWRMERPRAKLPAQGLPGWLPLWFARGHKHVSIWKQIVDNQTSLLTIVGIVTGAVFSVETLLRGRRDAKRAQLDSERAQRESDEGRIQAAVDRMMQPFSPQKEENKVIERGVIKAIQQRILHWREHATIIAGRFGSGKSVAVEDALRGRQGVYVHIVEGKEWKEALYKSLRMDDLGMLKDALRRVRDRGSIPVLVLDIPRSTTEGTVSVVWLFVFDSLGWQAWTQFPPSPRFSRRMVRWRTPGPEDSVAVFCWAAVGSGKLSEPCRGDRLRLLGRHGPRLRCRWSAASGQLLGG